MAPATSDLPSAADHRERLNRMNMVLAKHSSTLAALKRSKPSTSTSTPATKAADGNNKKTTTSSFSALKKSSAAAGPSSSSAITKASSSNSPQGNNNDDDDDDNFISANAGIGFVKAGQELAHDERSTSTRDLRGKLLGKRAWEQKEDALALRNKKRKGGLEEDESDEDEGRSKIGKGRKKGGK